MSLEGWRTLFEIGGVILLFLTFVCGAGVVLTGKKINALQAEEVRQIEQQQRKAAEEQKQAAAERLAVQRNLAEVTNRQNPRIINREKFLKRLEGVPKKKVEILYNPNDVEAYAFANQIRALLGPGVQGAGWEVSEPRPIPSTGGNELFQNAPPQVRHGSPAGAGITLVTRNSQECGTPSWRGLLSALGSSLGLPAVAIAPAEDPSLPDGTFRLVIGQKP
jgi:hypothetical protein